MAKVPPLRKAKKPNIAGGIPENEEKKSSDVEPTFDFITQDKNGVKPDVGFTQNNGDFSNSLVTPLVTPLVTRIENTENLISNPLVTPLVTRKNDDASLISNPLVTPLVTRKWTKPKRLIHENLTYKETRDLVLALGGKHKTLVHLVAKLCHRRRELSSGPITTETLRSELRANSDVVKSTIEKVRAKGFVDRDKVNTGKRGNVGFVVLTTTAYIRDSVIELESISNPLVTPLVTRKNDDASLISNPLVTPLVTQSPCSSSTPQARAFLPTTTEVTQGELPDEWMKVDFKPVNDLGERMGKQHLETLFKSGKTTPEKVQESVNRIAFAVNNKTQVIKKTPTAMLMGLLPKGKEFDPPKGYYKVVTKSRFDEEDSVTENDDKSPEDIAREKDDAKQFLKTLTGNIIKSI